MDPTILRRVAKKIALCGYARVEAPNEMIAHAWAKHFNVKYEARVEEGTVDYHPAWLVIIEGIRAAKAEAVAG